MLFGLLVVLIFVLAILYQNVSPEITFNEKGVALENQGNYEEALQAFNKTIELDPKLAMAWSNKGKALKLLGRTTEADAAFAKANELGYTG